MATINITGANRSTFQAGVEYNNVAGRAGYDSNLNQKQVCRFKFTTDSNGASSVDFKTTACAYNYAGTNSPNAPHYLRWDITASATTYKTYSGDKGYAAYEVVPKQDSWPAQTNYYRGKGNIKLMPNTTYYLWIFPGGGNPGYTSVMLGSCALTISGAYGTASTITASNGTFGNGIPITLSNSVSGVKNTLTVSCGGITKTLLSESTAASVTWTPTLAEYGPAITGASSATATFTVTTKYGTATWGTRTKTITVSFASADASPSIDNIAITYDNAGTAALAITRFVQGYSRARAMIAASGQYGATIASYTMTINGATVSGASSALTSSTVTSSGTVTASVSVTDSRGFTATATQTFSVDAYSNPTITNASIVRCDSGGTADEAGTYYSVYAIGNTSSLGGQNTITMTAAHKTANGSYGTEQAITSGIASVIPGLSADVTYVARITLTDALGNSATGTQTIPAQNWGLKFTVKNGGVNACGIGKAPESDNVLEIPADWSIKRSAAAALFSDDSLPAANITGELPVDHGGTGATSAASARANLGLGSLATVSNLNSKFSVEEYTVVSGGSVSANTYASWTKAISKSGYYPLAIVGIDASGSGSTSIPLGRFFLSGRSTGAATINVLVRNVASSAATPTIKAQVLWVSTT